MVGKASIFDHVICLFNELKMGIQYHNTLKYAHNIIHKVMLIKFIRSIFSMPFHEVMGPAIGAVVLRDRFVTGPFYHGAALSQCRLITVPSYVGTCHQNLVIWKVRHETVRFLSS